MPTKTILSPAQRAAIFDPPADRAIVERLYTRLCCKNREA